MSIRRCYDCGFMYDGSRFDDAKCRACSDRASTQMLALVMLAMLAAGVCGAWLSF